MSHSGFHGVGPARWRRQPRGQQAAEQLERSAPSAARSRRSCTRAAGSDVREYQRPTGSTPVPFTAVSSSKAWAQAYLYAVERMQGRAVALGSDFNGLAGHARAACRRRGLQGRQADRLRCRPGRRVPVHHPGRESTLVVEVAATGSSTTTRMGSSNNGMLPDFIEDLKRIGLTDADLAPLFGSAEQVHSDVGARRGHDASHGACVSAGRGLARGRRRRSPARRPMRSPASPSPADAVLQPVDIECRRRGDQ